MCPEKHNVATAEAAGIVHTLDSGFHRQLSLPDTSCIDLVVCQAAEDDEEDEGSDVDVKAFFQHTVSAKQLAHGMRAVVSSSDFNDLRRAYTAQSMPANLHQLASRGGLMWEMNRTPQSIPHHLDELDAVRSVQLAKIRNVVAEAMFMPKRRARKISQDTPDGGSPIRTSVEEEEEEDPVLVVGDWSFYGEMTVLYDGSKSLSNSTVHLGCVTGDSQAETMKVAVKSVQLDSDAESIEMIRREVRILKGLDSSHPHVLPMLHCAETQGELVLLTPYAPTGDLQEFMRGFEVLEEIEARRLVFQLLSGLAFLHERRVIHGDIKPANLFLTDSNGSLTVELADFGLSVRLPEGQEKIKLGAVQGTSGFMPAEVIDRQEVDYAIDLFALGVMTFRLIGGHDPFYPVSKVTNPVEYDDACWEPVSDAAKDFATRLVSLEPDARGTSASLLADRDSANSGSWLGIPEADLETLRSARGPRGMCAPHPKPDVRFKSLEAANADWQIRCRALACK